MKIDSIIQNINMPAPAAKGQVENSANNSAGTNSRMTGNASSPAVSRVNVALSEGVKDKQQYKDKQPTTAGNGLLDLKAVFALDKEKNVVIRVLDKKGEVVRQFPPEEYINMIKKFRENVESLFSKEV